MSYALALFLISPILVLLLHLQDAVLPFRDEFWRVLAQTATQAFFSSLFALLFGLLGAPGLLTVARSKWRRAVELFVLSPSLLPALFVIVATLNLVGFVARFPFGLWGVVIVHVVMNVGLVSVAVARLIESASGGAIELAAVEGASRVQLLRVLIRGLWRELFGVGFFVFTLAFAAFSVPLIVGAERGETLEVLIYRAVMGQGDLGYAVGLSLVQMIAVAALSWLVPKAQTSSPSEPRYYSRLGSRTSLMLLLSATLLFFIASWSGVFVGLQEILQHAVLPRAVWLNSVGSFFEGLIVGAAVWVLLYAVAFSASARWLQSFLLAYLAPSAVVTALALFLIFDSHTAPVPVTLTVISVGFALLVLPSLYRYGFRARFMQLQDEVQTARVLGARRGQIFWRVLEPQLRRDTAFLAGVAALWASGDFAFASLVAGRELTLAMMAQGFLGGYRIEVAAAVTWLSLGVGFLVYCFFGVIGYVFDQKSRS